MLFFFPTQELVNDKASRQMIKHIIIESDMNDNLFIKIWAKPGNFVFIFGLFLKTMTNVVQNLTTKV